jgi:ABC-type sugar transport system substrate-binding protein
VALVQALYVSPMNYGENVTVDALSHALDHTLGQARIELRVAYADFRADGWLRRTQDLIRAGVEAGVDAVLLYSIDPLEPEAAVTEARQRGVPVVCLERPRFDVDASVVLPNFNHGVYMSEYLATLVPPGAHVGIVSGPGTADDTELVLGIVHGLASSGLHRVNDPDDPRYQNALDVRSGGKDKTANLLSDFARLDAIVPYNDETALGAIDALREAGRLGSVKTVSRNGSPDAIRLVAEGVHHGTWDHDVLDLGRTLGELVIRLVRDKEDLDGLCVASAIGRMITPERARTWSPWQERTPWHPLRLWPEPAAPGSGGS